MELYFIQYKSSNRLMLHIGSNIYLDTSRLQDNEKIKIKDNSKHLDTLDIKKRSEWLKNNIKSYNSAYRTLNSDNIKIIQQYNF